MTKTFTSESVSEGHPDKVCDQISDAILDAYLAGDPESRVACETLVKNNEVIVAGEITSSSSPDLDNIIRNTILSIGYDNDELGFNGNNCKIVNLISKQSPDIAQGVNEGEGENLEQGAGDQGLMFGYACSETESLMPAPIDLSHRLVKQQSEVRKNGGLDWLRPDAKSQVSAEYDDAGNINGLSAIVLSTQHDPDISQEELKIEVLEKIIKTIVRNDWLPDAKKIFIKPNGRCVSEPTSIFVDTFGTSTVEQPELENIIRENFDLRPKGIIKMLDLKKPIYQDTAAYGHFGRDDKTFSWELIDKAKNLIA